MLTLDGHFAAMYNSETVPTTVSQVVRSIYKSEGLRGFYAGFRGVAIGAAVYCLYFSIYEPLKLYCIDTLRLPYLVVVPILSPLTMIAVSTLTYPNDLIIRYVFCIVLFCDNKITFEAIFNFKEKSKEYNISMGGWMHVNPFTKQEVCELYMLD